MTYISSSNASLISIISNEILVSSLSLSLSNCSYYAFLFTVFYSITASNNRILSSLEFKSIIAD